MPRVIHNYTCTNCIPIDKSILDVYLALLGLARRFDGKEEELQEIAEYAQAQGDYARDQIANLGPMLALKVDKVRGKDLSSNDYTDQEKAKLGALPSAAELDVRLRWKYEKPLGGIPQSDLSSDVQAALLAAISALQPADLPTANLISAEDFNEIITSQGGGSIDEDTELITQEEFNQIFS